MPTSITSSQRYLGRLEMVWFCRYQSAVAQVAIGFTMEDKQGREEVLKGGTLVHAMLSCPPTRRSYAHELDSRGYDSHSEGKELPGYNASRGPIVGSLQVLEVVVGLVSVDSFRGRLTSSTSGEIGWAFDILWDARRKSDARPHLITVDPFHISS